MSMQMSGTLLPSVRMIRYVRGGDNLLEAIKWDNKTASIT
jgi:hypothetical protein